MDRLRLIISSLVFLAGGTLGSSAAAQQPPPIHGFTGTVALEGTIKKEHAGANTVIVKTEDGVEHIIHVTKNMLVHGGKKGDGLEGLTEGSTVVVHYTMSGGNASAEEIDGIGDEGLKTTEGTVTRIERGRKQIVVRFDNGQTETFRLTDRATADAGKDVDDASGTRVLVYYTDENGQKVAHFFKRVKK
jgi:hypothetical protein